MKSPDILFHVREKDILSSSIFGEESCMPHTPKSGRLRLGDDGYQLSLDVMKLCLNGIASVGGTSVLLQCVIPSWIVCLDPGSRDRQKHIQINFATHFEVVGRHFLPITCDAHKTVNSRGCLILITAMTSASGSRIPSGDGYVKALHETIKKQ